MWPGPKKDGLPAEPLRSSDPPEQNHLRVPPCRGRGGPGPCGLVFSVVAPAAFRSGLPAPALPCVAEHVAQDCSRWHFCEGIGNCSRGPGLCCPAATVTSLFLPCLLGFGVPFSALCVVHLDGDCRLFCWPFKPAILVWLCLAVLLEVLRSVSDLSRREAIS